VCSADLYSCWHLESSFAMRLQEPDRVCSTCKSGISLRTIAPHRPPRAGMMRFLPGTGCHTMSDTPKRFFLYDTFASRLPG
jgi:hypothetical protein